MPPPAVDDAIDSQIVELNSKGLSIRKIANLLSLSKGKVESRLRLLGTVKGTVIADTFVSDIERKIENVVELKKSGINIVFSKKVEKAKQDNTSTSTKSEQKDGLETGSDNTGLSKRIGDNINPTYPTYDHQNLIDFLANILNQIHDDDQSDHEELTQDINIAKYHRDYWNEQCKTASNIADKNDYSFKTLKWLETLSSIRLAKVERQNTKVKIASGATAIHSRIIKEGIDAEIRREIGKAFQESTVQEILAWNKESLVKKIDNN